MMPGQVVEEVRGALSTAIAKPDGLGRPGPRNAARSRNFVEALADRLRKTYRDEPHIAVFSKYFGGHRKTFGLNELLFDILVCQTDSTAAARGTEQLSFIARGVLAVESEFARDSREAMYDFNKLVLCAAECKLFIGPRVTSEATFLAPLSAAAAHCTGTVLAVLVPHPSEWTAGQSCLDVSGHQWSGTNWVPLSVLGRGGTA
ncbi:MAG: hypothetical protein ABTD50_06635 [Polyangiaceae bacterium]